LLRHGLNKGVASAKSTTHPDEIKKFVEERDGQPARVRNPDTKNGAGILRIDFPGGSGEDKLEPISWDEFFDTFDSHKLTRLYQEETEDGKESRFVKSVHQGDK